jgi:MFS family permease
MLYGVVLATGNGAFLFVKEPASKIGVTPSTLREQFQRGWHFLVQDLIYRRYIIAQMLLQLAGIALPFYAVYAKSVLNAPEGMVGVYVFVRVGALLFSNVIWGPLSDRRGNRLVMMTLCAGHVVTQALALCLVLLLGVWQPGDNWLPYLAFPLFFMSGALQPAQIIVGGNFLMELVSEAERALYLGLFNTLLGIVILISGLGGIVVDHLGFVGVFGLAMGFALLAYVLTAKLPEPRETPVVDARPSGSDSDVVDELAAG